MKKIILTTALTSLLLSSSFAQESGFGIKGGINLSTYEFKSTLGRSTTPDRAVKPRVGIFVNSMISDQWAFQFEVLYNSTGYKPETSSIDKISFNYLAVPLMFKHYMAERFNIHAGPELGLFLRGKIGDEEIKDGIKLFNLGIGFGAEAFLTEKISLSARYTIGLTNTDDSKSSNSFSKIKSKTDNISFALSILF